MANSKITKSIFKGGAIIFLGYIISKLFGLIYRVIVGRYLGPEQYGIIAVMLAVYSVGSNLSRLGLTKGVQKYVSSYRGENDIEGQVGVIRTGALLVTISSLITAGILFLIAPWLSTQIFNEPRAIWPIRFAAILLPLWAYKGISIAVTDAYEKMQYHAYTSQIYPNVAKVVLTLIFVLLGYNYLGAAAAFAIGYGIAAILAVYYAYKMLPETFKPGVKGRYEPRKLFDHSWPLFAAGILASIAGYIDTFMLQAFLGSREVGLYNSAYPFAAVLAFGGAIFGSIYLSNASKLYSQGKTDELVSAYSMIIKWTALVSIPMFMVMIVFPELLLNIFGAEYLRMRGVLRILAIGFLASALIGPISGIIQAFEKTEYKLYITLFTGISNISLNYLLIPIYGVIGAAFATAVTFILAFAIKLFILLSLTGQHPFRTSTLKIGLAGALAGTLAYLTTTLPGLNRWTTLILGLTLFSTAYLTSLLLLKTLEEEDLQILRYIKEKTSLKSRKLEKIIKNSQQK